MKVIILEFINEAQILLERYGEEFFLQKDVVIVCLQPKVRSYLKRLGVASSDTVPYFDNNAQHRIILKIEEAVTLLLKDFEFEDNCGVKKGYKEKTLMQIREYMCHMFRIIEILDGIREKHSPAEIYCCKFEDLDEMLTNNVKLQENERFLGFIAEDFCLKNNISFNKTVLKKVRNKFENILLRFFVRFIGQILFYLNYSLFKLSLKGKQYELVVVPALSYRMDILLKEIKNKHPRMKSVMIWEGNKTLKGELFKIYLLLKNIINKLKNKNILDCIITVDLLKGFYKSEKSKIPTIEDEFVKIKNNIYSFFPNFFYHKNISIQPYLWEKIGKGLKGELINIYRTTNVINVIFKEINPILLISMYSSGIYYNMGELANNLGICSLNISHGTHVPPNNEFERIENYRLATSVIMNTYEYVAVQTPWADSFLDYYRDSRPRLKTGPLIYSNVKQENKDYLHDLLGISKDLKIIVHATTLKKGRKGRFHITETLDEYIAGLSDLIKAVNELDDVFLVIRPHKACDMSLEEIKSLLPLSSKFKLSQEGSFSKVLSCADILVSYSSTCIEEALQNNIPVILYDKWHRYNHFNVKEVEDIDLLGRKPVYYITKPELLDDSFKSIFKIYNEKHLSDDELDSYKYPEGYRRNFMEFVDKTLNGKVV